jgi:hypothetical protein
VAEPDAVSGLEAGPGVATEPPEEREAPAGRALRWDARAWRPAEPAGARRARALRAGWPLLALAAAAALAAVFEVRYGLAAHYFQPDELETIQVGRGFDATFFHILFEPAPWSRGPERLVGLVFALPNALFSSTPTVYRVAHVLFTLIYLSACLPVYLLARNLRLQRGQAVFPAAAAILTPWMLFGGTMLNVTLGYATAMWLAFATWRATVQPGWRGDALVLLCLVVATLARLDQALFLAAVALAVLVQVWRDAPAREGLWSRLRSCPLRLLRAHPLLCAAGGIAVGALLALGAASIVGHQYSQTLGVAVTFRGSLDVLARSAAELAMGTGYLPLIIALPWLAREAIRPRARETGAFAVIALGFFAVFVGTVIYSAAGSDERYVAVLAGLPPLAAALAIFRREVRPLGVAIAGVLIARAIVTQGLYSSARPYDYFVAPARLFFTSVMQGQASTHLPFNDRHIATTLLLAIAMIAVALVLLSRRPRWLAGWGAVAGATLALALPVALGATAGIYVGNKFEASATFPSLSFNQLSFVDGATRRKGEAAFWDYTTPGGPSLAFEELETYFFNESMGETVRLAGMPTGATVGPNIIVAPELRTGRLSSSLPLPPYIVAPVRFTTVAFQATQVAGPSPALSPAPLVVERFDGAPRLAYAVLGTEDEGWIVAPGHSAAIRLYPSSRPSCFQTALEAPPSLAHPIAYAITGPGVRRTGTLGAGATTRLLLAQPSTSPTEVRIALRGGGSLATGVHVAAGIARLVQVACAGGRGLGR